VQAAYAILISKELGPSSYGVFASITALSIIGSMFSGWGCDQILIKNVSIAKEKFQKNFGSGLVLILITYPILLPLLFTILYFLLHTSQVTSLSLILFITADLLFTKTIFFAKACFAVFERPKNQLVINLVTTITKLLFLLLALKLSTTFTLDQWAIWYFVSGLLAASFSLIYVAYHLGLPQFGIIKSEFVSGMQFCIEQASLASLKDLDKPIIVAMMGAEQGGYFAVAFKLVDAASSPIRGMLYAVYVRYFKASQNGEKAGIAFALKVLPYLISVSLVIGLCIYFLAWTLPLLLGQQYQPSVDIVKQLWLYPLLIGLLGTGVDLLRSIGRQLTRTYIMIASSLATAPILYVALTYFGIAGAAYAKIFVLIITVATAWWIIYSVKSKQ
jgi:O-antigen/teichoic acid export membrane protein